MTTDLALGPAPIFPGSRLITIKNFDDGGLTSGSRNINVYLPGGYGESVNRYPVVYLNDGQSWLRGVWNGPQLECDLTHDQLVDEGLINPAILVAINFIREGRIKDLTPAVDDNGNLEGYYKFISSRLKPYVDNAFRTITEPSSTAIVGISMGGLASFLLAYNHPETFGLAACMSPSFWHGDRCSIKMLLDDYSGKKNIRFWLDAGGSEYVAWKDVVCVHNKLEKLGWSAGDELASYFDYTGAHVIPAWRDRMRHMLYFLLRKNPIRFIDYRIVSAVEPDMPTMDMAKGLRRIVGAEALYANNLRLNVPHPDLSVDNIDVAIVDSEDPILLNVTGSGETTIRSTYLDVEAVLKVSGYNTGDSHKFLQCSHTDATPVLEDVRTNLFSLPNEIRDESQHPIGKFDVLYDPRYVHVIIEVIDSSIISDPATDPRNQDSIWICLDARPEPVLCRGEGYDNTEPFLNIIVSPSDEGQPVNVRSTNKSLDWLDFMPEDTRIACAIVTGGYHVIISVPSNYLDEIQGDMWRVFRLNIGVSEVAEVGGPVKRTWWHPEWHLFTSPVAAGIFERAV